MGRQELKLTESSTEYNFTTLFEDGRKSYSLNTREWQPGDAQEPWRVSLHDWDDGLGPDRFHGRRTYAKADMDASNSGILVPPPLLTTLSGVGVFSYSDPADYAYGRHFYGEVPYMGVVTTPSFFKGKRLGEKEYFAGGRYLYSIDAAYSLTLEKDFGEGKSISDIEVYQSEVIIGMGESEKLWTFDGTTFTQASNNTYAIALGVVDNKLWRAESTNKVSNCVTAPRTLASWAPSSGNQYEVGDTTFAIKSIIDYGGVPWVEKNDGVYAPDAIAEFHNQVPQLHMWPSSGSDKTLFLGWGFLWVATPGGLVRLSPGEAKPMGPEETGRPDFQFQINGGAQFGKDIYLLCTDGTGVSNTFVCKMTRVGEDEHLVFHELSRLGTTTAGTMIMVTSLTPLPAIILSQRDSIKYLKLGRGGSRFIDDPSYPFAVSFELETGFIQPTPSLSVVSMLMGVEAVLDANSSESITLQYAVAGGSFANLLTTQEGGGSAPITNTSGYTSAIRYAPADTTGPFFSFKLTGTLGVGQTGSDRPEVRELWAFGYSHPKSTDIINVDVLADSRATVRGIRQGRSAGDTLELFRNWRETGAVLTLELPDYEEDRTTRCRVVTIEDTSMLVEAGPGSGHQHTSIARVGLMRLDYAGDYAD